MQLGSIVPELCLLGGALACLLAALALPHRHQGLGALLAVISCCAALVLQLSATHPPQLVFSGTFALDTLTTGITCSVCICTALVASASPRWFVSDARHGEWYALLLMAALGALLLAGASDATQLLVAMLLSSVTGYTLASYHRGSRMSAEAGAKFFLLGALTNPLLLLGVVFVYAIAGSTRYAALAPALAGGADALLSSAAFGLVLIGLLFELGAAPAHAWVPDVAQGSPAPAAAFLTVVPKLGALAAVARFVALFPGSASQLRMLIAMLSLLTMTLGNLAALWQHDVRRLLGWSSVSQAGYALLGVVALGRSPLALPSLLVFAVGYALANVAAFAVVIALRGRTQLAHYRGLARTRPWHALALSIALLSLVGIPPLVGFGVKLTLFAAALGAGYAWLALAAVVNTVISLFYYLRVIAAMVLEPPAVARPALLGPAENSVAACASLLVLIAGVALELVVDGSRHAALLPAWP